MHHCTNGYLLFSKWLVDGEESRLPNYTTHYVGTGGLIINDQEEILLVEDLGSRGKWIIPGGLVNDKEMLTEAVEREV